MPRKSTISISIESSLLAALDYCCYQRDITRSAAAREAIKQWTSHEVPEMKRLKPQDLLAAELERIIKEAQAALKEYRAATAKASRRRPVEIRDPRNGKRLKVKERR